MSLFVEPRMSPSSGGNNYAGAKLYFYLTGTTTPAPIYTDAARTTQHANPVIADSGGVFAPIWLDPTLDYRRVLKTSAGASLSDVDPYPGASINQDELGAVLWPRTDAEIAAGVIPVYYYYEPGDVRRYGIIGDGVTDNTVAIQNAIKVAATAGIGVFGFYEGSTYRTANITMYGSSSTIPACFDGGGATFKALAGTTGYLFDIITPQSNSAHGFRFENAIIDGNAICTPLRIYGSQRCIYGNLLLQNSSGPGLRLEHELGGNGGIYYNTFYNIVSGASGKKNASAGYYFISNTPGNYTCQDNTFLNCQAQFNKNYGWDVNYASGTWVGCGAEKNDFDGFALTNVIEATFTGGYTEHNNQNWATGGVSNGTQDYSFILNTACNGVKIFGGRCIGNVRGAATFQIGNVLMPGNYTQFPNLIFDEQERLRIQSLLVGSGGGVAYAGGGVTANAQNWLDQHLMQIAGSSTLQLRNDANTATDETCLLIRHKAGGAAQFERVSVGAADSGAAGYRLLRIPN